MAEVDTVGMPIPQYSAATTYSNNQYMPKAVDVKVKLNNETIDLQKLPADSDIADFGQNGMVIATNRECILQEVETLRTQSQRILDSIEQHRSIVANCGKIIEDLNPQLRQEAERNKEIDNLKGEISSMKAMLEKMMENQK